MFRLLLSMSCATSLSISHNSTVEQLKALKITPALVPNSHVQHLASETLKTLSKPEQNELTSIQVRKFNRKYNQNLFNLGV